MKKTLTILGMILLPIVVGGYIVGMFKLFESIQDDVRREMFENTKSYLYGIQQDLSKYYSEYQAADTDGKTASRAVIRVRFSSVDSNKLQSPVLRRFLKNMNGLFMPILSPTTCLLMIDSKTEEAIPVYIEPEIIDSPFPMH